MLTLERLAFLMESMVHRVDGYLPFNVVYYDGGHSDIVDEGIDVFHSEGSIWIDSIERVDDDGIIHCKDHTGESVEVEIFERVRKSLILGLEE